MKAAAAARIAVSPVSSERQLKSTRRRHLLVIVAFAAVYLIWGSTYLAIQFAIQTIPPFLMAATRFLVAGSILFVWSTLTAAGERPSLAQWKRAFLIGGLLLLCGNGGVTWAEKFVASGLAALLVATEPLWVVVINWIITRKRPDVKVLLGVFVGLVGVAILVSDGFKGHASRPVMSLIGAGVVVLSGLAWAAGSVYANRRPIQASTSMASGMQMLAGGALLLIMGVATGDLNRLNIQNTSWISFLALCYLIVFGSLIAFTAYAWLLRNVATTKAATYAYVNPVVAVILGWLIAAEPVTTRTIVAAGVIVGSVVLITTYGAETAEQRFTSDKDGKDTIHSSDCPSHPCA